MSPTIDEKWTPVEAAVNADQITSGAVNPRGICRALVKIADSCADNCPKSIAGLKSAKEWASFRHALSHLIFLTYGGVGEYPNEEFAKYHDDYRIVKDLVDFNKEV